MGDSVFHRTPLEQFLYEDCKKRLFLEYSNLVKRAGSEIAFKALQLTFHEIETDRLKSKLPVQYETTDTRGDF